MPWRSVLKACKIILFCALVLGTAIGLSGLLPSPWHWVAWAGIGVASFATTVFVLDMIAPGVNWLSHCITRIQRPSGRYVVLTFDDGPVEPFTREVVAALQREGARGTFFCVGDNLERNPDLVRLMAQGGHDVANHTRTHPLLPLQSDEVVEREIMENAELIRALTGSSPTWLRCPKGYKSRRVQRIARRLGHELVGFSYPAYDIGETDPAELAKRVIHRAAPGDILLLHDGHSAHADESRAVLVEALPAILRGLRERGLEPLSLSQALEQDAEFRERSALPMPALATAEE